MCVCVIFGSDMPWAEAWWIQHVCVYVLSCNLLFLFMLEFVLVASMFEVALCHRRADECCAFVLLEYCPVVVSSVMLPCCCCCFLCSLNSCVGESSFWWLWSLRYKQLLVSPVANFVVFGMGCVNVLFCV